MYKWLFIAVAVISTAPLVATSFTDYSTKQCKISYATSNKTVEEINQLCK